LIYTKVYLLKHMIDVNKLPSVKLFRWTRDYLFQVMAKIVIDDSILLSAFKEIDRADFVPEKLRDSAYSDQEIEIAYGERLNSPIVVADMLNQIKPVPGGTYLDIGTGTGYVAALLAYCATETGKVYSMERLQWLWEAARNSVKKYKFSNVEILYRDGLEGLPLKAPYDGIHVSFIINQEIVDKLKVQLKNSKGKLVFPDVNNNVTVIERDGENYTQEIVRGHVFKEGKAGIA
jgi:protein-L-isoaspartate(D-aspartate) O-methyltransferase